MKTREPGFYIVTLRKPAHLMELPVPYQWVIGYWNGTFWKLPGSGVEFADSYFENIDEVPRNVSAEIEATIRG